MPVRLASFALMLATVFLLVTGHGIVSTLVPFRAKLEGFPDVLIGCIGSSFYAGMLGGAVIAPALVRRAGHIGGFTVCAVTGAVATLAMPALLDPVVWVPLRFCIGFSLTGLYAIIESWLSGAADDRMRGKALAICSVAQYAAWAAGNQLFAYGNPGTAGLFVTAAILFLASVPPFWLIRETPPARPAKASLDLRRVWHLAPAGCACAFLTGTANGPLFALSPVFGAEVGLSGSQVGMMMTAVTLGSALLQMPIGWLSDRWDRRRLILALASLSTVFELVLALSGGRISPLLIDAVAFAIGSVVSVLYYVGAAHAVDRCGRDNAVMVMAAMMVLYGTGAILAPPVASALMAAAGAPALYLWTGAVHVALAGFVGRRLLLRRTEMAQA